MKALTHYLDGLDQYIEATTDQRTSNRQRADHYNARLKRWRFRQIQNIDDTPEGNAMAESILTALEIEHAKRSAAGERLLHTLQARWRAISARPWHTTVEQILIETRQASPVATLRRRAAR